MAEVTPRETPATEPLRPKDIAENLRDVLDGNGTADTAAVLAGELDRRPVTAERLVAVANVLRGRILPVQAPPNRVLIDVADAGVDPHGLVDVTTGAALLVAACDGTVVHHGLGPPRMGGVSILSALGIPVDLDPSRSLAALEWCGFAHVAAPRHHPWLARLGALRAAAPRFFALLAPLLNPACPERQLVGVEDPEDTGPLLDALVECGARGALVVSSGGAPFLTADADAVGHAWVEGKRTAFRHAGGAATRASLVTAGDARDATRIAAVLSGAQEPLAEAVALTAGAAMWVAGMLPTLTDGRLWAADRLAQGVDLADLGALRPGERPPPIARTRTAPASVPTSPRSPRPPRAGGRRGPGRRG